MGKYSCGGKTYHVTSGKSEKKIAKAVALIYVLNKTSPHTNSIVS
jgi:hypothetical protein